MRRKCPLCGFEFDPRGEACHASCPLAGACSLECCPQCGYTLAAEERGLAGVLKNALVRLRRNR